MPVVDRKLSSDQIRAFLHPDDPKRVNVRKAFGVKSYTVILDRYDDRVGIRSDISCKMRRLRVAGYVRQGLLKYAKNCDLRLRMQIQMVSIGPENTGNFRFPLRFLR